MAVDMLRSANAQGENGSKIKLNDVEDRYGTYGCGPNDRKKYYLRKTISAVEDKNTQHRIVQRQRKVCSAGEKEKHLIINPDLVRTITVPVKQDPSGRSIIIYQNDYERIKAAAHVLSSKEKQDMLETALQEHNKELEASKKRKDHLQAIDKMKRKETKKLSEIDLDKREKRDLELKKAQEAKLEEEEEMRELNHAITEVKQAAILNKQIATRQRLEKTLQDEERRLENLGDQELLNSIQRERERINKAKEMGKKFGYLLECQIKDKEQMRLIESEKRQEERRKLLEGISNTIDACDEEYRLKRQKQKIMKEGLDECLQGLMTRILEDRWQDKIREKEAEVFAIENERRDKERKIEKRRLLNLHQQLIDKNLISYEKMLAASVDLNDVRLKRDLEDNERKWRQKEKEEQLQKQKSMETLKRLRQENLELNQKITAVYMQEAKNDYQEMIRFQKESIIKEKEMEKKAKKECSELNNTLLEQIKENEAKRIKERADVLAEGAKSLKENERILGEIKELKAKKIQDLKEYCPDISEDYLRFVDRKVKISTVPKINFNAKNVR